jgi:hypothetical protein
MAESFARRYKGWEAQPMKNESVDASQLSPEQQALEKVWEEQIRKNFPSPE